MRNIGFDGGSFLCELGPSSDVQVFFNCVRIYMAKAHTNKDCTLLTDRLYRRYLKLNELDAAVTMMEEVRVTLCSVPSIEVEWKGFGWNETHTRLDVKLPNLADVFAKYFEHFNRCVESSQLFFKSWNIYQPVKIVVSDLPEFMTDKKRPLEEYDELDGDPFWLR